MNEWAVRMSSGAHCLARGSALVVRRRIRRQVRQRQDRLRPRRHVDLAQLLDQRVARVCASALIVEGILEGRRRKSTHMPRKRHAAPSRTSDRLSSAAMYAASLSAPTISLMVAGMSSCFFRSVDARG